MPACAPVPVVRQDRRAAAAGLLYEQVTFAVALCGSHRTFCAAGGRSRRSPSGPAAVVVAKSHDLQHQPFSQYAERAGDVCP